MAGSSRYHFCTFKIKNPDSYMIGVTGAAWDRQRWWSCLSSGLIWAACGTYDTATGYACRATAVLCGSSFTSCSCRKQHQILLVATGAYEPNRLNRESIQLLLMLLRFLVKG